jgi:hypothetical protein
MNKCNIPHTPSTDLSGNQSPTLNSVGIYDHISMKEFFFYQLLWRCYEDDTFKKEFLFNPNHIHSLLGMTLKYIKRAFSFRALLKLYLTVISSLFSDPGHSLISLTMKTSICQENINYHCCCFTGNLFFLFH